MATLNVNGQEITVKFSIALDKALNKAIPSEKGDSRNKLTGGLSKVLNDLLDMDVETLAKIFETANNLASKENKVKCSIDDIFNAIDERMNEDGEAIKIFSEVFAAIDESAFTRNELKKFVNNMKLVKYMRSKDFDERTATVMLLRLNDNYKEITGENLFPEELMDTLVLEEPTATEQTTEGTPNLQVVE